MFKFDTTKLEMLIRYCSLALGLYCCCQAVLFYQDKVSIPMLNVFLSNFLMVKSVTEEPLLFAPDNHRDYGVMVCLLAGMLVIIVGNMIASMVALGPRQFIHEINEAISKGKKEKKQLEQIETERQNRHEYQEKLRAYRKKMNGIKQDNKTNDEKKSDANSFGLLEFVVFGPFLASLGFWILFGLWTVFSKIGNL